MRLAALQRTMARAVMQPLTASEHMQQTAPDGKSMRAYASRFIKPNDRLTSFERLEIYNRQYWFRLLSSMIEDFPGLRAVLGDPPPPHVVAARRAHAAGFTWRRCAEATVRAYRRAARR